jgi:hypothetical protein
VRIEKRKNKEKTAVFFIMLIRKSEAIFVAVRKYREIDWPKLDMAVNICG